MAPQGIQVILSHPGHTWLKAFDHNRNLAQPSAFISMDAKRDASCQVEGRFAVDWMKGICTFVTVPETAKHCLILRSILMNFISSQDKLASARSQEKLQPTGKFEERIRHLLFLFGSLLLYPKIARGYRYWQSFTILVHKLVEIAGRVVIVSCPQLCNHFQIWVHNT